MTLKRLSFLVMALLIAIPGLFAQEDELRLVSFRYGGATTQINPSDDDPVFTYNPSTGFYEGVTVDAVNENGFNKFAFKFYTKKDGEITYYGPSTMGAIDFTMGNPYERTFDPGSGGWYINKFYNPTSNSGKLAIAVNLKESNIWVLQEDAVDEIPEVLYIWGSTDGGQSYTKMGALTPTDADGNVFGGSMEVPDCPGPFVYDDPEFKPTEEDAPSSGFMFLLTPEADRLNKSNILRYGAHVNARTVNMEDGQTTATVQMYRNDGGSVIDQTPGFTEFSFNLTTLELTLTVEENTEVPEYTTQEFTWSYASSPCMLGAMGTGQKDNYGVAMKFDMPGYAGMKIVKIDAYLNIDESTYPNVDNTGVFMTSELSNAAPSILSAKVAPQMSTWSDNSGRVPKDEEVSVLSYELETPYVITSKPIYVGYNIDVLRAPATGEKYPVLLDKDVYNPEGFYINTPYLTEGAWQNEVGTESGVITGVPIIVLTIEREVSDYSAGVSAPAVIYAEAGKDFEAMLGVVNSGLEDITSLSYQYTLDGGSPVSGSVNLEEPLVPNVDKVYDVLFPIKAVADFGEYELQVKIVKVNGHTNGNTESVASTELDVFPYLPVHVPLMEEYTALSCGYCPRGFAAMEYIDEEYPDDAVVISYHLEFNGRKDPMTFAAMAPISTTEYPTASIDRLSVIDPYYGDYTNGARPLGIVDDLFARAAVVPVADIKVTAVEVVDSVINVTTNVNFMKNVDNDQYRVGYVLSANGIYNATWAQTNYFSKDASIKDAPLLQQFYNLPANVYGLTFNDVAINVTAYRGLQNSLTNVTVGTPVVNEYSFNVKDVKNLYGDSFNEYLKIQHMVVNAFIIEKRTGQIVNACKFAVGNAYDSVATINPDEQPVSVVYYDLAGRRVANPDKGIFIKSETLGNGSVRTSKVVK